MSRFHGKQGKHAGRADRLVKRDEAEERNARTPHENTKRHRIDGFMVFGTVRVCPNCPE
jgi:hypothetical protein